MRPKVICHMVSSVDGRLLVNRWTPPAAGIDADIVHRTYEQVAARFDSGGWIVGRKTMEDFAEGIARTPREIPVGLRQTHIADRKGRDLAVGSTRMAGCTTDWTTLTATTSWRCSASR
jgi:hypothetical protein